MDFFFQNNSVENSLICPRTKSASHCLTELFPIYQNKHWTIRRRDDHIVVQSSHHNIFKIDWFLVDKRVSYGAVRPGFDTPVGRELFRICENWIGGVFGGNYWRSLSLFLLKYKKKRLFLIKLTSVCVILHIFQVSNSLDDKSSF